jgi:uncharacterized membrane protein
MSQLAVWTFDTDTGAESGRLIMLRLSRHELINVFDAASVRWPRGGLPCVEHLVDLVGNGALGAVFWNVLVGSSVSVPLLSPAPPRLESGVDVQFLQRVRRSVQPGTSALLVLARPTVSTRLSDEFANLVSSFHIDVPERTERALRSVFADH